VFVPSHEDYVARSGVDRGGQLQGWCRGFAHQREGDLEPVGTWRDRQHLEHVGGAILAGAWNVPRNRDAATGEITHPSLVYVLDDEGSIVYATRGGTAAVVELLGRV
jgi:hypothetical protein